MKAQVEQQKEAVDKLIANTRLLEQKMAEARSKKDTLKARLSRRHAPPPTVASLTSLSSRRAAPVVLATALTCVLTRCEPWGASAGARGERQDDQADW